MAAVTIASGIEVSARPISKGILVPQTDDLTNLDLHAAAKLVQQKKVSPVQLTQTCLARIEALNPILKSPFAI